MLKSAAYLLEELEGIFPDVKGVAATGVQFYGKHKCVQQIHGKSANHRCNISPKSTIVNSVVARGSLVVKVHHLRTMNIYILYNCVPIHQVAALTLTLDN